jgi:hypothetical protein
VVWLQDHLRALSRAAALAMGPCRERTRSTSAVRREADHACRADRRMTAAGRSLTSSASTAPETAGESPCATPPGHPGMSYQRVLCAEDCRPLGREQGARHHAEAREDHAGDHDRPP